jgi:subtilisin family serine protease
VAGTPSQLVVSQATWPVAAAGGGLRAGAIAIRAVAGENKGLESGLRLGGLTSLAPHDDGEHGTHTMGTIVGDDGRGNQIGMAPEARWIGCRNMRRGIGNPTSYTECMEFLLAPYPLGGDPFRDGDVNRSPDVINNSWACPDFEGCEDDTLKTAVEALRAAGVMMVVSAGNEGPACRTATEPPARYAGVFSVGATDRAGKITFFSSRGPILVSGEEESLVKPDIVAPGDEIRPSVPGAGYASAAGTSGRPSR